MTISLAVLDAMVETGCTAAQVVAALRADREERERRRLEARARREAMQAGIPTIAADEPVRESGSHGRLKMNEADSAVHNPAPATGKPGTVKVVARSALLMMRELRPAARLVGAQLVECCNLGTGRCDPSIGYIASKTGLSERSVRRAIGQLVASRLFARVVHGGRAHCNAYRPDWVALAGAAAAAENGKMNNPDSVATRTLVAADPDSRVRQNLLRKPDSEPGGSGRHRARGPDGRQREILFPIVNGGLDKTDAAFGAAQSRLWQQVHRHHQGLGPDVYSLVVGSIPSDVWDRATALELQRRGSGLPFVLQELQRPRPPPASVSG